MIYRTNPAVPNKPPVLYLGSRYNIFGYSFHKLFITFHFFYIRITVWNKYNWAILSTNCTNYRLVEIYRFDWHIVTASYLNTLCNTWCKTTVWSTSHELLQYHQKCCTRTRPTWHSDGKIAPGFLYTVPCRTQLKLVQCVGNVPITQTLFFICMRIRNLETRNTRNYFVVENGNLAYKIK